MKIFFVIILALAGLASISYAVDLTTPLQTARVLKLSRSKANNFICPVGYAFTAINSSREESIQVMIEEECEEDICKLSSTICDEMPKYTFPVNHSPNKTYTCQKIKNHWAGTLVSGKRG